MSASTSPQGALWGSCPKPWGRNTRVERIIARVEAGPQGTDSRFVVTNLAAGLARTIYEDL